MGDLDTRVLLLEQQMRRHKHSGEESAKFSQFLTNYYSQEIDNGSVSSTATIDWNKGNVQYITLTGATTLTFIGAAPGMRMILHVAGAFTPTFPSSVRWSGGTTPTATATSGKKDIYTFVYSGKEGFYDGLASLNYATT